MSRYAYINFLKLVGYLEQYKPKFAALSTYWGVGFPYLAILDQQSTSAVAKKIDSYNRYFDNDFENFLVNTYMNSVGYASIQQLLSKSESELKDIEELNNVLLLDKFCYINNVGYTKGWFHDSIFVSFSDEEDGFIEFITEYNSGKKYIKYKDTSHRLEIGKRFFVIKNYHVGLLEDTTMVVWDRTTSSWKKPKEKLFQKISAYIEKKIRSES
jgi:hypothetical protein